MDGDAVASTLATDKDRDHGRPGAHGQHREALRRRCRAPEERDEHALAPGRILVQHHSHDAPVRQGAQHAPKRAALIDQLHARLPPEPFRQRVQRRRIERAHDDRERVARQPVGRGEQLPVAEVRRQNERPPTGRHDTAQVLEALETDRRECALERAPEGRRELDEEQAEVLEGAPADTPALGGAERGERDGEVGERHASPPPERDEREVAEPPPEPGPRAGGQPPDEGEDRRQDQAARRRRSLRISTAIGITDRTITTMTTM